MASAQQAHRARQVLIRQASSILGYDVTRNKERAIRDITALINALNYL